MRNFRTDLACEARAQFPDIKGVTEQKWKAGTTTVTRIEIIEEKASIRLHKPKGRYVTIETPGIVERAPEAIEECSEVLANELSDLIATVGTPETVMVVGLGNRMVTPDSLGPSTTEKVFVTRHIQRQMPSLAPKGLRAVCTFQPGVLGVNGMETAETVHAIVGQIKPDLVICIDALISMRASRIHSLIQINNAGLSPGAGVGNQRPMISEESLHVPVIAIGVPMVVDASTIAEEAILHMIRLIGMEIDPRKAEEIAEGFSKEHIGEMIVASKDIDQMIADAAGILAAGINRSLHRPYYAEIEALLS